MKTDQIYNLFKLSSGISTDSRTIVPGQIFFALWGENVSGNAFAADALKNGASWAVIDDILYETDKTILVDDCLLELQALATRHRKEMNVPVLAITGTNGKTTTKEMIAAILSKKFKVHYTKGNLNNHLGVPLTILSAPEGTEMMIIEMGASHAGEIKNLCLIANPDHGIITNIGFAHLEGFGSPEGIVKAKTELYEHIRKVNGVALYDDKDTLLSELIFKIINRAVPYSDPTGIELSVEEIPSGMTLQLSATYFHTKYNISTKIFGSYNLQNFKAAIACGLFFEVEMQDIVKALEEFQPADNRSQIKNTQKNTLICDSYNSNPTSVRLALESFSGIQADHKIVILGDMLELGEKSYEEHVNVLNIVKSYNFENVMLVGPQFQKAAVKSAFSSFPDVKSIMEYLTNKPIEGKTVLIKGSRGIGLEKIYPIL